MPRKPAAGQQQLGVARIKKLPTPPLSRQNCARAAQKARREVVCRRQMKQKPRPDSEIGFVREDRLRAFEPIFETLHAYPSINPRHYKILHAHSYAKRLTSENIPRLHGRPCAVVKDMSVLDAALDLAGLISKRAEQDEAEARKNVLWRRAHAVHGQERIDPYRPVPQPIVILNVSFDESLSPPGGLAGIGNSLPDKKLNMREDLYFRTSLPMCFESDPRAPQAADEESMFMPDVAEAAEAAEAENAEDAANDEALPPPTTSMQEWRPPSLIPGRILYTPQTRSKASRVQRDHGAKLPLGE
ncbi:hypothetical protein F503_04486 [Ophiostoma piceae UAMH 11346]|uniref:Uncharacterized protein n=1 Tax=Ophiostoma piceae (strain UAMH 11346) TaxID=1262450 RepID=S3C5T1_OPHP1|nr:hypothetical protein F503_04486 [Ophiostoma piceae UAMH 11346]